ncbi:hypothetical protein H5410_035701 [Solanum commersonii]|uniref:Uncharacterized protein n=1 Tax=Solanum commersonii TaxID=4109 RepID=A0A9J5Y2M1_SOLCO|nr:hypothetical protein H5410_035701 [Solanum commersonii]
MSGARRKVEQRGRYTLVGRIHCCMANGRMGRSPRWASEGNIEFCGQVFRRAGAYAVLPIKADNQVTRGQSSHGSGISKGEEINFAHMLP